MGSSGLFCCVSRVKHFLILGMREKERFFYVTTVMIDHCYPPIAENKGERPFSLIKKFFGFLFAGCIRQTPTQFLRFFIGQRLPTNLSPLLYAGDMVLSIEKFCYFDRRNCALLTPPPRRARGPGSAAAPPAGAGCRPWSRCGWCPRRRTRPRIPGKSPCGRSRSG